MMIRGIGEYDPNYEMLQSYYGGSDYGGKNPTDEMLAWYFSGGSGSSSTTSAGFDSGASATGSGSPIGPVAVYRSSAVYRVTATERSPSPEVPMWLVVMAGAALVLLIARN